MRTKEKHSIWAVWAICLCLAGWAVLATTWVSTSPLGDSPAATPVLTAKTSAHLEDRPAYPTYALTMQEPELPNGCEITSLSMLLEWAGYGVDKVALYEGYLPRQDFTYTLEGEKIGGDPEQVYVGDATSQTGGWYCFEGPIVEAGNAYLRDQGSRSYTEAVSGLKRSQLETYLEEGTPVMAWVTLEYTSPVDSLRHWYLDDGSFYQPLSNLHCVVVVDQEGNNYLTADPLKGWRRVDKASFWAVFDAMGRRAVVVTE